MKKTDIYNRVYLIKPITEAVFSLYLAGVCREITSLYGEKHTACEGEIPLVSAYENALVQGILYCHTGEKAYREAYHEARESAYRAVWRENEKKRRKEA